MYVIKRSENHSYGRNVWKVIHTTPDVNDALSFIKSEYRMLLESDPNMRRSDIDSRLSYSFNSYWNRQEVSHRGVGLSIYRSTAAKHQEPVVRPERSELLDKILG